jgi:hypothetical protein
MVGDRGVAVFIGAETKRGVVWHHVAGVVEKTAIAFTNVVIACSICTHECTGGHGWVGAGGGRRTAHWRWILAMDIGDGYWRWILAMDIGDGSDLAGMIDE